MIPKPKRTLDYIIGIDVHIKDVYGLKSVLRGNIMVIWFNSEKARTQLFNHGEVVTCRKSRKSFGVTSALYKNKDGNTVNIGHVHVKKLFDSISNQRRHIVPFKSYLDKSGFESVEEWQEEVKRLNSNRWIPQYLIFLRVSLME